MTHDYIRLGTREDGTPHVLPVSAFDTHAQFIGPTRYGKTRAMAQITQQLILKRPKAAFVVVDPKGDLYDLMKDWAYQKSLDGRLVLLDVRERDGILGFNPLKPHSSLEPEEQANLQYNILANVWGIADQQTAVLTHQREKWIRNALLGLICAQLTYNEAVQLLDPTNGSLREAVIPHLPPSDTLGEFLELQKQTADAHRNPTALRALQSEVGHSIIQFKRLTASAALRRMYANDRTVDFRRVFDHHQILLVRLAPDENVIDLPHQKLLGMQIVNEVIREAFGRPEARRVQTYCVIDEAGRFATDDVTEVLEQGGSYKLSLFLAHQQCEQLKKDQDRKFLDSVLTNAHLKFVTGGLAPPDAKEIGETIARHLLDPDKPHLATATKRQLQKVVQATSKTIGIQEAHAHTEAQQQAHTGGRVSTDNTTSSRGRRRSAGHNVGEDAGVSTTIDPLTGLATVTTSTRRGTGANNAEGDDESDGTGHGDSEINMDTEGESTADTYTIAKSKGETTGPAVHPGPVFEEFQPESLDIQLHRFTSKMIRQPRRHLVSAQLKEQPVFFRVADVPDPKFTAAQLRFRDRRLIRRNPQLYAHVAEIEAMIAARQQRLLSHAVVLDELPLPQLSTAEPDQFQDNDPIEPDDVVRTRLPAASSRRRASRAKRS